MSDPPQELFTSVSSWSSLVVPFSPRCHYRDIRRRPSIYLADAIALYRSLALCKKCGKNSHNKYAAPRRFPTQNTPVYPVARHFSVGQGRKGLRSRSLLGTPSVFLTLEVHWLCACPSHKNFDRGGEKGETNVWTTPTPIAITECYNPSRHLNKLRQFQTRQQLWLRFLLPCVYLFSVNYSYR